MSKRGMSIWEVYDRMINAVHETMIKEYGSIWPEHSEDPRYLDLYELKVHLQVSKQLNSGPEYLIPEHLRKNESNTPQCPKCKGEESPFSVEPEGKGWKCHECNTVF